jgi:expansin (peptidoglycan-binding protein)
MVLRCASFSMVRLWVSANSVRFMYRASSRVVNWWAMVVLPTHGVPVIRMTRLFINSY